MFFKFFKKLFSGELGKRKKMSLLEVLIFLLSFLLSVIIPTLLVYLEAWEVTFNLERLIWRSENPYRIPYFIILCLANVAFVLLAMFSIYAFEFSESPYYQKLQEKKGTLLFNEETDKKESLLSKNILRAIVLLLYPASLILYVFALIN